MICSAYIAREGILGFIGVWGKILGSRACKPHPPELFTVGRFENLKMLV